MLNKKQYLRRKYDLSSNKDFSLYFYQPPLKANEIRKLRRYCNLHRLYLSFLPSSFSFTHLPESHGPSIMCVTSENLSFSELNLAKIYQDTTCVLNSKFKTHLSLQEKYENPKDYAKKFVLILHKNLK